MNTQYQKLLQMLDEFTYNWGCDEDKFEKFIDRIFKMASEEVPSLEKGLNAIFEPGIEYPDVRKL